MTNLSPLYYFSSTNSNEWPGMIDFIVDTVNKHALMATNDMPAEYILNTLESTGLNRSDTHKALKEFYHACVISIPIINSYLTTTRNKKSVLYIISSRLLKDFADEYDYEFQDDLLTLFAGVYNIIFGGEGGDTTLYDTISRLNVCFIEFYNNNTSDQIPKDDSVIDIRIAPIIIDQVLHLSEMHADVTELSQLCIDQ